MDYGTFHTLVTHLDRAEQKTEFANLIATSLRNLGARIEEPFYVELQTYSTFYIGYYVDGHINIEEPTILDVCPSDNYKIVIKLNNWKVKILDMNKFLDKGDFAKLKDYEVFKTVKTDELQGIEWDCFNLSLSKDTILKHSRYL